MFAAGQWVDFFAPGVDQIGGYSIASPPSLLQSSGLLQLVVSCPRLLLSHTRTPASPSHSDAPAATPSSGERAKHGACAAVDHSESPLQP